MIHRFVPNNASLSCCWSHLIISQHSKYNVFLLNQSSGRVLLPTDWPPLETLRPLQTNLFHDQLHWFVTVLFAILRGSLNASAVNPTLFRINHGSIETNVATKAGPRFNAEYRWN
jgi:hypothetical protein